MRRNENKPIAARAHDNDDPLQIYHYLSLRTYSLQAKALCQFQSYPADYWYSAQFMVGVALFFYSMRMNWLVDAYLTRLRRQSVGYQIPLGGWFDRVSDRVCRRCGCQQGHSLLVCLYCSQSPSPGCCASCVETTAFWRQVSCPAQGCDAVHMVVMEREYNNRR
jgi:hypothetical protein